MGSHATTLAESILLVIGVSIVVVVLFQRLRLPAIVGFILTGTLIGPYGLKLVEEAEAIQLLADMGLVLLLFSLGVEFSIDKLLQLRHYVLRAGIAQIGLTILLCLIGAGILGYSFAQALALGMIISLSSTAVGIKLLKQRQEQDSTHGRFAIGVLLFQDVMAPLFMAMIPFMARLEEEGLIAVMPKILIAVVGVVMVYLLARIVMPFLLKWLTASETREIPVLGSLFIALLMGYLSQQLGLSPALGAFVAGILISETPYSYQITANIVPFRDSFLALFFISVGMLVDMEYMHDHWGQVLNWTLVLILLKGVVVVAIGYGLKRPLRVGILAGVLIANIGEFSYVLMEQSLKLGILPADLINGLVAGTSLSILLTAPLLAGSYRLIAYLTHRDHLLAHYGQTRIAPQEYKDHIVIVGFGLNGRNLALLLSELQVPFVVVELNGALVQEAQKMGIPVVYGDAAHPEILHAAGVEQARAVVIAISDPISTRYTVQAIRTLNPTVNVIARTRYVSEIEPLYAVGATDVVSEEFETFIEIAGRIMRLIGVDNENRLALMNRCRARHYEMLQATREGLFTN